MTIMSGRGKKRIGLVFCIECVLGCYTGFLAILTLVWRDWIEGVFGYDPDHHNGSFEWELVIVCALLTVVFVALARREWRSRAASATSTAT
jgi:H+/Cl- antiporter ClcA